MLTNALADLINRSLITTEFTQSNPPTPDQPALKVGLGLGFAGLWLIGFVAVVLGLVLFLPKLFRQPPEGRATE